MFIIVTNHRQEQITAAPSSLRKCPELLVLGFAVTYKPMMPKNARQVFRIYIVDSRC